ncbi:MAG TPA: LpqB family beta-propeller domain-containing protein [Thermoanaerobaculia bacterium]
MIGTRLGSYEITAKLGEGGMGEVYRATDTKLDRQVAIKVLPAEFTEDKERLARFEREAKLLAQLHHPNIASIFGLEESEGTRALVMELVEGPTLAERLESGALPFNECLSVSLQIAHALEEAHEKGIIHRDLKPQNIKASMEGKVKVLDFGLAKAMDPAAGSAVSAADLGRSPTLLNSPTLTAVHGTQLGVILGTAAYMAPEQAKGLPIDKRADIWAFGVVLFEMLSGRSLFAGDTVTDTLAGVLKTEVDFSHLPGSTPAAIRRLLRRCLERNPKNRLHDIADARLVIEDALAPGRAEEEERASRVSSSPASSVRRLAPWALVLLAMGGALGWLASRTAISSSEADPKYALRRLTDLPGLESQPDLSPDGRQLVYSSAASGNLDVYVMRTEGGRAINLTAGSPADDEQASFSPDGERLVFRSSRDGGGLFLMGATGESVRRLTDGGFDPAWSPDGRQIAYSTESVFDPYSRNADAALWIVDVATGEKRQLQVTDAVQPAWSPDGRRLAYWANTAGQRDVWTIGVEGGEPAVVTRDLATDWSPEWSPDGRWLYFASDRAGGMNLFRVAIETATGRVAGAPVQRTTSVGSLGWFRFSADGRRLVASAHELSAELELFRLTPGAEPTLEPLRTLRPRSLHWCRIAPDAEWLACATIGTPEDLVLLRADGSELRRLTDDVFKDRNVAWSADGTRLAFQSTRAGGWNLWTLRADGSEPRRITEFTDLSLAAWFPDGQRLSVVVPPRGLTELDPDQLATLATLRPLELPGSMPSFEPGAWSPSGRFLGGTEVDASRRALSIGAFEPATGRYHRSQLPVAVGHGFWKFAGWLPDSRRYVALGREQIALVDVETGAWRGLLAANPSMEGVALSGDGRTLLVETQLRDGDLWMLESPGGAK